MSEPRFRNVARACDLLEGWTGFEFRDAAPNRLADFLETRAETLGLPSVSEYLAELSRLPGDADEPQRIINLITNGLTAFWRDEPQLEALREVMRGSSLRHSSKPLNIWCAGCSTGEEAYTAAMISIEEGIDVSIVGSDINTDFLARARMGRYDTWSLRRLDEARRARWFGSVGNDQWQVSPELRDRVVFRRHNLQEPASLPPQRADWDVILCRNVLIYFATASTRRVLRHFAGAVDPEDGYLILGSSEHLSGENERIFRAARAGSGFVYRSVETKPGRSIPLNVAPLQAEGAQAGVPIFEAAGLEEETIDFGEDDAVLRLLDSGRHHLRLGRAEAALACFEATTAYDPFVPETYCLMGHAFEGAGAPAESLDAFQKALFLDPAIWIAAARIAQIAAGLGEEEVARRAHRQVLRSLTSGPRTDLSVRFVGEVFGDLERAKREAFRRAEKALASK